MTKGHEAGGPRRELEEHGRELPLRDPEQEPAVEPEQQPGLSCCPQLHPEQKPDGTSHFPVGSGPKINPDWSVLVESVGVERSGQSYV